MVQRRSFKGNLREKSEKFRKSQEICEKSKSLENSKSDRKVIAKAGKAWEKSGNLPKSKENTGKDEYIISK